MEYIHISGSFTDKDNACKFCSNFMLWGTSTGYCRVHNEDMSCNDTCDKFNVKPRNCTTCAHFDGEYSCLKENIIVENKEKDWVCESWLDDDLI